MNLTPDEERVLNEIRNLGVKNYDKRSVWMERKDEAVLDSLVSKGLVKKWASSPAFSVDGVTIFYDVCLTDKEE